MFKANNELLAHNLQQLFNVIYTILYVTRQSNKLRHVYARTTLKDKCIYVYGVKLWNSLDDYITGSATIQNLKKKHIKITFLKSTNYFIKLLRNIECLEA